MHTERHAAVCALCNITCMQSADCASQQDHEDRRQAKWSYTKHGGVRVCDLGLGGGHAGCLAAFYHDAHDVLIACLLPSST